VLEHGLAQRAVLDAEERKEGLEQRQVMALAGGGAPVAEQCQHFSFRDLFGQ
jgi:hypothetical protein